MKYYKDKIFCGFRLICKKSYDCDKVLTEKIAEDAIASGENIVIFDKLPECFKAFFMPDVNEDENKGL